MGFDDVTTEYNDNGYWDDDGGYWDAQTEPSAPRVPRSDAIDPDELPATLWSKAGPPVIAGGLLVIAVAIGTYLGMRTAQDQADKGDWPGGGPDASTMSEEESPESATPTNEGAADSDSDEDDLVDVADVDQIDVDPNADDAADGDSTEGAADAAAQADPADTTGARETGSAGDSDSSTDNSQGDPTTTTTTTPEESDCEWAPPGRPDHPKPPDHCD